LVGGSLSGDKSAYEYLPRSVENFMDAEQLAEKMRQNGFVSVTYRRFGAGSVAIHTAVGSADSRSVSQDVHSHT
jgi:demethylmenaquinone methyltransferase/2-methoxy-6-polyprenyl-1,4-benzoquinol methylase